jgi:hypothetical protein
VLVDLHGSIGGATMIKMWFIGRGLKMEFRHPKFGVIRTSRVRNVVVLSEQGYAMAIVSAAGLLRPQP